MAPEKDIHEDRAILSNDGLTDPVFCDLCKGLTMDALSGGKFYNHVQDILELESLASWCSICNLLKEGFLKYVAVIAALVEITNVEMALQVFRPLAEILHKGNSLPDLCPLVLRLYHDNTLNLWSLEFGTQYKDSEETSLDCRFGNLINHRGLDVSLPPLRPRLDEATLFDRYRRWISRRPENSGNVPLPNRVLDLDPLATGSPAVCSDVRLLETSGGEGVYATLSYCWGSYRGCLTECASYEARLRGIAFHELPVLFQHAVLVTRRLHIRYLWIDALCIIQDSEADWRHEATLMADIYRNGRIRIAVSSAKSPTEGFYPPRPIVPSVRVEHLTINHEDISKGCFLTLPKRYTRDVTYAWLNSRAWVLQERLLAPTTLHFCLDHIYFESSNGVYAEDGEDGPDSTSSRSRCIDTSGLSRQSLMHATSYSSASHTCDYWLRITEVYSSCRITRATDKMIAIAALMQDRQLRGRYPYLHCNFFLGMWETTLCEDLLWVATPGGIRNRTPFERIDRSLGLPSWASISYQGEVWLLKDERPFENPASMRTSPIQEFEKPILSGDYQSTKLPFPEPISMTLRVRLSKIPKVGSKRNWHFEVESLEAIFGTASPFRHYPGTRNRPKPLLYYSGCFELLNEDSELIGFVSFDTLKTPPEADLWCAHLATAHDESYKGPDPLSRIQQISDMGYGSHIPPLELGEEYIPTEETHILAYCWVLAVTGEAKGKKKYERIGIAEVKYEWIVEAPRVEITVY